MKTTQTICQFCEKEFEARRNDAQFCSSACKQQSYLQRKSGEHHPYPTPAVPQKQIQAELEELLIALTGMWDRHIKNESNLTELKRKIAAFRQAHEILLEHSSKNKSFINVDLHQLPTYSDLLLKIDEKNRELTNNTQQ